MSEFVYHPATELKKGDHTEVMIRHETDGSKNRHRVPVTVIENFPSAMKVFVIEFNKSERPSFKSAPTLIPYNDVCLKK